MPGDAKYLWCQVESQIAATGQAILHKKRNLVRQAKLNGARKSTGLAEVDKVFEGEGKGDRLSKLDLNIECWLVDVGVASEGNSAVTDISIALEFNTILRSLDWDYSKH